MPNDRITLAHGSGGRRMQDLISKVICRYLDNPVLRRLDDAAVLGGIRPRERLVFSTDGFVVQPIIFPGGDIGKLAVCGTVNDLAMMGAKPLALSLSMVIEEGFALDEFEQILRSVRTTSRAAGVPVVCGDTKVVSQGNCDKIFLTTSGIGVVSKQCRLGAGRAKANDVIIVSGTIGEHEIAILNERESLGFMPAPRSDCAPLYGLVRDILAAGNTGVHVLRDPTRGGLATVLNEISETSNVGIRVDEKAVPLRATIRAACELLGLDPLYLACEGRVVVFAAAAAADQILVRMRNHPLGRRAAIIGCVPRRQRRGVVMQTVTGAQRVLDMLVGKQMPRIC